MLNIQINDKVRVKNNKSGHDVEMGMILTVKNIIPVPSPTGLYFEIRVKETPCWFHEDDIEKVYKASKKPGKIIISDPAFFLDEYEQENIQSQQENNSFPIKTKHKKTSELVLIHKIESTPYGNGEYLDEESQPICVTTKLLCIAQKETDWLNDEAGAKFETLQEAKNAFPSILNRF